MAEKKYVEFSELLRTVQKYITENHPDALNSSRHYDQIKPYVKHYIRTNALFVEGMDTETVVERLYSDMVEYSFLSEYMRREDVNEININAWNDVVVSYADGRTEKIQSFYSPNHALDTIRRMLAYSRATMDDATPLAEGQLPNNARITAMKTPLVDQNAFVSASARLLHPSRITIESLISSNSASEEMLQFLCCCLRYGVSFVVAGATYSGKTTLLNALLKSMPDDKRIYTIESGSRELDLVRKNPETGTVLNNVVHTLARKSEKKNQDITMEKLVVASLRYNPDLIVVGEMRDEEASAAIDASLTGHTLVSTIHSFAGEDAHMRLATLCQKKHEKMELGVALMQAAKAFPIVCFEQMLGDGSRKITNITECEVDAMGHRKYHVLYRYVIDDNVMENDKLTIHGHYETVEKMSDTLRERMMIFGIPSVLLKQLDKRQGGNTW